MSEEGYAVTLTFQQWMDICFALGHTQSMWSMKEMEGEANKYRQIRQEITAGLQDD